MYQFRPIATDWRGEKTSSYSRKSRYTFRASYDQTRRKLLVELEKIKASNIVVQIDLREQDIRIDGMPRANARVPEFPGVIVSFDSDYGPLRYQTDVFETWESNLRAIALGLEALRKVDRYGITKRGEQYTGWKALPSGAGEDDPSSVRGATFVEAHGSIAKALHATHPDHEGGNDRDFRDVQAYRESIGKA